MKSLEHHILDNINKYKLPSLKHIYSTIDEYLDLNGFTEETVTSEQIRHYYEYRYNGLNRKYVNENLLTHESLKLIKKIKTKYSEYIDDIYEDDYVKTKKNIVCIKLNNNGYEVFVKGNNDSTKLNNSDKSNEFLKLIAFFNYYVSLVNDMTIYLEPLFTKPCLATIKKNGAKIYHVTLLANYKRIMKLGIIPKVGKSKEETSTGYRYFPSKSFYIMNGKTYKDTYKAVYDTLVDKEYYDKKYVILEVDVSSLNLQFYLDEAAKSPLAIYTFNAMDPSLITNKWYSFYDFKNTLIENEDIK